jgi:hypothetical protein
MLQHVSHIVTDLLIWHCYHPFERPSPGYARFLYFFPWRVASVGDEIRMHWEAVPVETTELSMAYVCLPSL